MPSWSVGMIAGVALGAAAVGLSTTKNRQALKHQAQKAINSITNFTDDMDDRMQRS